MSEKLFLFGQDESLVGILSEPETPVRERPVVIFINAGLTHHVGPHGLHVELARAMSELGFSSLRFDLSGKGDSDFAVSSGPGQAIQDISLGMDALQSRGYQKFILCGLCSGADDAYLSSLSESRLNRRRLSGIFLIDGLGYRNRKYWLHHYLLNRLSAEYWKIWYTKKALKRAERRQKGNAKSASGSVFERDFPTQADATQHLQKIVDEGIELLLLYTGGVAEYYNYPNQFLENFPSVDFKRRLRLEFMPSADHTFSFVADRRRLNRLFLDWLDEKFGKCP